jgi:hypothetical protein
MISFCVLLEQLLYRHSGFEVNMCYSLFQSRIRAPVNRTEVEFIHWIVMENVWRVYASLHRNTNTTLKYNFSFEINYIFWLYTILVFNKINDE